jgi:Dolichyl-phosphate-mannose-protein mannosyltransferase
MSRIWERAREHGALLFSLGALLVIQAPVLARYGIHRDELYFVECGRHLAAGYVDHPPLVPWIARLACEIGGCGVLSLRLPSLLARLATVALTVTLARRLGGRGLAQLLAGLAVVFAPAFERMGKILCIPVFEPLFWTGGALLLLALSRDGRPRLWLGLGALMGLGLLNKHTMLIWAAGAGVAVLVSPLRAHLRTRWPWLAVAVAVAIWSPNLIWQAQNGWATVEFLRNIRTSMLADIPRPLFLAGQLLYMHPFSALLWVPALVVPFRGSGREGRPFAIIFLVALGVFLLTRGKPYYLAPAYPALFAMGALVWERRLQSLAGRIGLVTAQVASGLAITVVTLPVLSLPRTDALVGRLLGRVVPPVALTHDLHDEFGWRELAQSTATVIRALPPEERRRSTIVTANYGEAAAINYFGRELGLPGASSGHMTFFLWGPANPSADVLITVGLSQPWLAGACRSLTLAGEGDHPLALPQERHVPIHVCRGLTKPLPELWPGLRRFHHGPERRAID